MKVYIIAHQVRDEGIVIDDICDTKEQAEEIRDSVARPTWAFNYHVEPWEVKRKIAKKE